MSIELNNNGAQFRILNNNNKDVTNETKFDPNNVKIQIDNDGDGNFSGNNDVTISDKTQLSLILDDVKSNTSTIKNVPFVNEIESKVIDNKVSGHLNNAKDFGLKAKELSIFNSNKVKFGKEAFLSTQKAYFTDKENPVAKIAYFATLYGINKSSFRDMAAKTLQIDLNKLTDDLIKDFSKDKNNIQNQISLKELYDVTKNSSLKSQEEYLKIVKSKNPSEFNKIDTEVKKAIGFSKE